LISRKISINAAPGAKILAGEILVLGRTGSGETYASGFLRDVWHIHRQDRLVWADALCLDKNIPDVLSHPACFDGATAQATAIYICDDPEEHLDEARDMITSADDAVLSSATIVNGILILRWLGKDAYHLRHAFAEFWKSFRHFAGGEVPELPKIWSV
jgi:urease accessory protein